MNSDTTPKLVGTSLPGGAALTIPRIDVFLSYKAEDRARLAPLVAALEAEGFSVWWDAQISGGTNWRQDIQDHLDAAKCVVVAWTKRSVGPEGDFVRDEAARARRRGAYLPVRFDAVEPPLGFGKIQALSLQGWKGDRSDSRFRALAGALHSRISGQIIDHGQVSFQSVRVSRRAILVGGAGVAATGLLAAGGWLLLKPQAANSRRIAVMPFANLSNDPEQTYFSEGVAEELRSALSRIGLAVIGRSSSDAVKNLDTKAAAAKLGVANILTGSIRRSPETIRIDAQLVSGSDGVERWRQSYDRAPGDAIKIQTDIATNVAQALRIALGQAGRTALALGGTADSVAQDLLLQSRKLRRDADSIEALHKVVALVDAALARDPNYAGAYVEKANALHRLATHFGSNPVESASQLVQAQSFAERAIALAPQLGSSYAVLAYIDGAKLELKSAVEHARQALALSPDDPDVLSLTSPVIAYFSDGREGLRLANRWIAVDPLNGAAYRRKAEVLMALRQYPGAIEAGRKSLELAPEARTTHGWIGYCLVLQGRPDEAKPEFEAMPADDAFRLAGEAITAARAGDRAAAKRTIERMRQLFGADASYQYAQIYAQAGEKDRAFGELNNAVEAKDSGLDYLKVDAFLDPIRGDLRYAALLRRLNFP
jgi:TolB-like protein